MKALSHVSSSVLRFALATILTLGALVGLFVATASVASPGRTGQALALRAALHPVASQARLNALLVAQSSYWLRNPGGRYVLPRRLFGAKPLAGSNSSPILINEPVQTFDTFAPPPAFAASDGPLTPTNAHPFWSPDGTYILFSSNRSADGRFHLWAISSAGDQNGSSTLTQITSGTGNEDYPTVNASGNLIAFVSDAANPGGGRHDLYTLPFSPGQAATDVSALQSFTGTDTRLGDVQHPSFFQDNRIVFAGLTVSGFHHLFLLNTQSGAAATQVTADSSQTNAGTSDDSDPFVSPDGQYIAFASNATTITPVSSNAPNAANAAFTTTQTGGATTPHSIWAISASAAGSSNAFATQVTNTGSGAAVDNVGPALRLRGGGSVDLVYASGLAGSRQIEHFLLSTSNNGVDQVTNDTATPPIALNTNNSGAFDDEAPTWSPVSSTSAVNNVAYASNRSISYNDFSTGAPSEFPYIAPQNFTATNANVNSVGPAYVGILQSQVDNLDPPTFLPYAGTENIHVTNALGATVRNNDNGQLPPGQPVTFTVRLSDREAGVDDNNVYIQIKDPDSKYQDYSGREHKVFTKDRPADIGGAATPPNSANDVLYEGGAGYLGSAASSPVAGADTLGIGFEQKLGQAMTPYEFVQFGVAAGFDGTGAGNGAVTVGNVPPGDNSQNPVAVPDPNNSKGVIHLSGVNPKDFFVAAGQEYECQFVNAQFGVNGGSTATDTVDGDYDKPYYLAGFDDQGAHTGSIRPPRPEWLHLTPAATQDANGGVLYTATWTTPTSPSDYYLDVIAYDRSVFNGASASTTTAGAPASGSNFRIYDNIWGFSTQQFNGANDILVVSDNTLGQKFAATTFSNQGLSGLRPLFYGAESYFTDIDLSLLPNASFRWVIPTGAKNPDPNNGGKNDNPYNGVQPSGGHPFGQFPSSYGTGTGEIPPDAVNVPEATLLSPRVKALNTLGVGSYNEDDLPQGAQGGPANRIFTVVGGRRVPQSQQYSIWRILSHGPLDPKVLAQYAPSFNKQPAVKDPVNGFTAAAADGTTVPLIPAANRCVVWSSPFTGDLPLNRAGSLADPATQSLLENYLSAGGRLFISGQDVGSFITNDGTTANTAGTNSLLPDFLNAQLKTSNGGTQALTGASLRVSGDAYLNVMPTIIGINTLYNAINMDFPVDGGTPFLTYAPPASHSLFLGNNYNRVVGSESQFRADGSLDQIGPVVFSLRSPNGSGTTNRLLGAIDTLTPLNGAHADIKTGSDPGLIYNENPANGSRFVYSSFGLEGIGTEWYHLVQTYLPTKVDQVAPYNVRQNIMHNIVCYLRTGTFTGKILNGSGGGGGVAGATVYIRPNGTPKLPGLPASRQCYSALTRSDGSYTITGVEPGAYTVYAYKQGFSRAASGVNEGGLYPTALPYAVEGDTSVSINLNITQQPPGSISGQVLDGNKAGVSGVSVTFTSTTDPSQVFSTTTAKDGTYSISAVPPDTYNGTATAPVSDGFKANQPPDAGNPVTVTSSNNTSNVNFTLVVQPGTLGGQVTDSFTHQPISGVRVTVTDHATHKQVTAFTTGTPSTSPNDGVTGDGNPINYTGLLLAGTYDVTITPPTNYSNPQPATATVTITPNVFQRVDFSLDSTLGQIGGLVTDAATGQPLAGATVTLTGSGGTFTTTADAPNTPAAPVGDGNPANFFGGQVPAGTYTVTVSAPNRFTQTFTNVQVTSHVFTRVPAGGGSIALISTLGTLGGLVTDGTNGQALAGAIVTVVDANGNAVQGSPFTTGKPTATPNDNGVTGDGQNANFYTGPSLPQGTYTITVSDQGQGSAAAPDFVTQTFQNVQITAGQFKRLNVVLPSSYGTLGGLIRDSFTHQPISGATVTVSDSTGNPVATVTSTSTTTSPGPPTGDNSPQNFSFRLYGGAGTTYTLTVSAANHTPQSNITATVQGGQFTRVPGPGQTIDLVSTQGMLGGLVEDSFSGQPVGGAQVTVTDSRGAVVTTFTTTSATTSAPEPNGDNNPVNYSGALIAGVPYNVTVSRRGYGTTAPQSVTLQPNVFSRVDFTGQFALPPTHIFSAGGNGRYLFFSVPYDYASIGVGFDQLFGPLNLGTFNPRNLNPGNANRSHVYVWNPTALQYTVEPAPPADGLHLGQGYWVFLLNSTAVTVAGTAPTGTVKVNLQRGWNMIGVPSTTPISVSNLTFNNAATGSNVSFAAASSTYRLISPTLYTYNGTGYDTVTAASSMQPWQAYWIYAFTGTTVQIPTR